MFKRKRIVWVVCTANVCRSPMIHLLLKQKLEAEGLSKSVEVRSAGVAAMANLPASPDGVMLLAERGLDLSTHRAAGLSLPDIRRADLILVMEEAHRRQIFQRAPQQIGKVLLFSELVDEQEDLADPYGLGRAAYETTLARIDDVLARGWDRLLDYIR
ncbi:low molecular weight protein arginine phosphatase [bacterium]|nr:low molecular weight protein arginine phosphatase [bacterium]